jgi:hypothetical protein
VAFGMSIQSIEKERVASDKWRVVSEVRRGGESY